MPHGHCYFWQPSLVWLHVTSDALIALAYYSIPIILVYFLRRRTDLKLRGIILMFAGFILACGTTHILSIWDIWHSAYRLEGLVKAITAVLSVATAIATIRVTPIALKIASPEQLSKINESADVAEARRESENQFRNLAESIPNLVWMADETGYIFWYNRRWYEYTGTTFEDMEGWGWKSVHDPAALPGVMERWQAAIAAGAPLEMVFPLRRADGEFRLFLTRVVPVKDSSGAVVRWFGTNTDIHDQETLRLRVEASEEKLRSFFEAASQGILGVTADGIISLVNGRTAEMFGYRRDELIGQKLEILLPERLRGGHVTRRQGYFADPRMRPMGVGLELTARRKDGTEFPIEVGLSHVDTPEGPLAFGMVTDISERRRSEEALLASEEKLRSFFEAASQAILGVTGDGSIVLVNRRTEEIFGYGREELLGQPLNRLIPERFRGHHAIDHNAYFDKPRMRPMGIGLELFGRRKDGTEFPADIGLSHVNTPEGPLAFALVNDISAQKKAAEDLEHANEALRRSNVEMEQFAHVASHDLQEPLRMITSYLQLVERRYADRLDADGKEFISFAVDGAKRMKALIKDLLEFSRAGSGTANFRTVSIGAALKHALDNLKTAIDESGAHVTSDELPNIVGEPALLTQVFQNLIANAMKFHQKGQPPRIHVSVQRRGPEFVFCVKDNGIGIEPRHLDRIFRIFERLHTTEEYAGSGIGLAITKKIVERHGGKIWVESQSGTGSTFYFSLLAETAHAHSAK